MRPLSVDRDLRLDFDARAPRAKSHRRFWDCILAGTPFGMPSMQTRNAAPTMVVPPPAVEIVWTNDVPLYGAMSCRLH